MTEQHILTTGLAFGESPRWRGGRLWFSDFGAREIIAVDPGGNSEVIARVPGMPMGLGFLPDGRLLVVSAREGRLLAARYGGPLATYADLTSLAGHPWSDMVVDGRGNAYVGNIGFDFPAGEFASGILVLVTPDGVARQAADGLSFANGMAITPDSQTLILAETYASRLTAFDIAADGSLAGRRVWADLPGGFPTASASTPRAPSGTPTSRASAASACAKAARCCRRSTWTAAASPARSAVQTGGHCS